MSSILARPEARQPDFVRACVHDLRNLFAVITAAKLLLDRPVDEPTKAILVDALYRVAADGKVLTDKLLAGEVEDRACGIDAPDELRSLASILKALEGPALKIELSVAPEPAWILMSASEFRAVVLELITNAARAGAHTIKIRAARRGRRFWLAVVDDGSGFADAGKRPKLSPLVGLHGTGLLRLTSAAGSAQGKVRIRSKQGDGSVVALTLPIVGHLPPARLAHVPAGSARHLASRRLSMASIPPTRPDRIDPRSPPDVQPPEREPSAPELPETEPLPPDIAEPGRGPEETPPPD